MLDASSEVEGAQCAGRAGREVAAAASLLPAQQEWPPHLPHSPCITSAPATSSTHALPDAHELEVSMPAQRRHPPAAQ